MSVFGQFLFVGERTDYDFRPFPAEQLTLPGYTLVNISAGYKFSNNILLNIRIDNLFDEKYEEVFTYGTSSRAVYGGVVFSL